MLVIDVDIELGWKNYHMAFIYYQNSTNIGFANKAHNIGIVIDMELKSSGMGSVDETYL